MTILRAWTRMVMKRRRQIGIVGASGGVLAALCALTTPAFAQYTQVWADDFNGPNGGAPDPTKWTYDLGNNFGNGELDWATNSRANSYLDGAGHLVIAMLNNPGGNPQYTSAHLKTAGLYATPAYGKFEASIKVPYSQGMGAAFWTLGNNYISQGVPWPYCGEIDIMETHGGTASAGQNNGTIHGYNFDYEGITKAFYLPAGQQLKDNFHVFGLYSEPYHVKFYEDGTVYSDLNVTDMHCNQTWPFNQPQYLILSAGVGGIVAGPPDATSVFPNYMTTDYVHVSTWTAGVPNAPSNLTAGTINSNAVQLNWSPSSTAGVTYNVYMNTQPTFTAGDLGTLVEYAVTGTTFQVGSLAPNKTYYFWVVANNPGGESSPTNMRTVVTAAPGNSTSVFINCGGYGVGKYIKDLTYSSGGNANNHAFATPNTTGVTNAAISTVYKTERWGASTYKVTDLNPNTLYTVRMHMIESVFTAVGQRQFNAFLNGAKILTNFDIFATAGQNKAVVRDFTCLSDESGTVNLDLTVGSADQPSISGLEVIPNTGANTLPAAPASVTATAVSTSQINLSWTASGSSGVTYNVYRGNDPYFVASSATLVASNLGGTTYANTVPSAGTTYYYRVTAVNANGQSARSNVAQATTVQNPNGFILALESGGSTAIGNFGPDQYWGGQTYTTTTTNTINTTGVANAAPAAVYQSERYGNVTYYLAGLTAGATYRVRLHNSENYWTAAGKRVFNVLINGTQVLTNFDIFATVGANKAVVNDFSVLADSSGHITIAFAAGTADLPTVKGVELYYLAPPTNPVPAAPTGLTASAGNAQINLSWNASSGATTYNLYRSTTAGGEGTVPVISGITGTSYTNTGLTNGTRYYYKVAAVNGSGTSAQSAETSAVPAASSSAISINAGGSASGSFVADTNYSGGGTVSWANTVDTSLLTSPVPPQAVLQTDREGGFTYTIPGFVAGSSHTVTLYFVENYFTAANSRVFTITANGTTTVSNLDVYAAAGARFKAIQRTFTVTANSSGQIILVGTATKDQAKVGGISIN